MTATAVPEVGSREVVRTPMLVFLEGTHEQWLQQVRGVLGPAGAEGAGMWVRWYAIEYLETGFKRRFERERRAVFSLHWRLTGAQASHLWAAGELIAQRGAPKPEAAVAPVRAEALATPGRRVMRVRTRA